MYGVDSLDPTVTLRRLFVLMQRLPAGTLPDEALAGSAAWSLEAHLMAGVFDAVGYLTYVVARVNGAKSARKPKPLPRPKAKPGTTPARTDNGNGRKVKWGQLGDLLTGAGER